MVASRSVEKTSANHRARKEVPINSLSSTPKLEYTIQLSNYGRGIWKERYEQERAKTRQQKSSRASFSFVLSLDAFFTFVEERVSSMYGTGADAKT